MTNRLFSYKTSALFVALGLGVYLAPLSTFAQDSSLDDPNSMEDPGNGDDSDQICGTFSISTLFDLALNDEVDVSAFATKAYKPLARSDNLWVSRGLESDTGQSDLVDVMDAISGSAGDEQVGQDADPSDDPAFDPNDPTFDEGASCFSIEDLLNDLSEKRCSRKEKKAFDAIYSVLQAALKTNANSPFVGNEVEDSASAKVLNKLLKKVAKKCSKK